MNTTIVGRRRIIRKYAAAGIDIAFHVNTSIEPIDMGDRLYEFQFVLKIITTSRIKVLRP